MRFTVRRMMVAVAIVGIACGLAYDWRERSAKYHRLARDHDRLAMKYHFPAAAYADSMMEDLMIQRRKNTRIHAYHDELSRKYQRLAMFPWLPVEPDPPEPK